MTQEEFNQQLQAISNDIDSLSVPQTKLDEKLNKLNQRTYEKVSRLNNGTALGTVSGVDFYDADSPYNTILPNNEKPTLRLGNVNSSTANYLNAPEAPSTIMKSQNREATSEEIAAYRASMIAKDNFAIGTTPASNESWDDMRKNPLSEEDWKLYQQYMNPALEDQGRIDLVGQEGKVGKWGRQVVQGYNPDAPNAEESLQDRLLATGNAEMYAYGKPSVENGGSLVDALNKTSSERVNQDGMLGESIDIAQSSLIQQYGKTNKAFRKGSRWLADKIGLEKETIDAWLPELTKTGTIGFGDTKSTELAKQEVADKLTGVMVKTREEQQKAMNSALKNVESGNYADAAFDTIKILPYILGDSTGEIASIMAGAPGIATAVAARVSEDAETYEQNNGVKPESDWMLKSALANSVALFGERFLVKSGIGGVLAKGSGATKRLKDVGLSTAGETVQEWYDQVQQEYLTQKEGSKELTEIATSPEAQLAAITGGVMGGTLKGTGEAVSAGVQAAPGALDKTKRKIEELTETETQKALREDREFSEPLREEAVTAAMSVNPKEVEDRVTEIHGRVVGLDKSAPKSMSYATVFRNALNKATEAEDDTAIENVYKTMAELDADEKSEFSIKDVVEDRDYELTQEFIRLVNSSDKTASERAEEIKSTGRVVKESVSGVADKNNKILQEVAKLKLSIEQEQKNRKSVFGSDQFEENSKELNRLIKLVDNYLDNKNTDSVNSELMELGYIERDPSGNTLRANPNKPGLKRYQTELKRFMFDTKKNENLLETAASQAPVSLKGFTRFANSRLDKLTKKGKRNYQTSKLLNNMLDENKEMMKINLDLVKTAKELNIPEETKNAYVAELEAAGQSVLDANKELTKRIEAIDKVDANDARFAFQVDENGVESIVKLDKKGKPRSLEDAQEPAKKTKPVIEQPITKDVLKKKETKKASKSKNEQLVEEYINMQRSKGKMYAEILETVLKNKSLSDAAKEFYRAQLDPLVKEELTPDTKPLSAVREKIAEFDSALAELTQDVSDMELKAAVKNYYNNKLGEIGKERDKLSNLLNRMESAIDKRAERLEANADMSTFGKMIAYADRLVKSMLNKLEQLRSRIKLNKDKYYKTKNELGQILKLINDIESKYTPEEVKTSVGKVKKFKDSLYGPMVEQGDKRVSAKQTLTKSGSKVQSASSALNDAMQELANEKIKELDSENVLGAKLIKRLLKNFPLSRSIHRIVKRGQDSLFGRMDSKMFANPKELIAQLPKSFKDVFMGDVESRESLLNNFKTMDGYIRNTEIGEIKIGTNRLLKNIDKNGLAMLNREKDGEMLNFPVEVLELIGDVKDGKLELDEQTETILKFYSAKLITDTHKMVGQILSMDESEMSLTLGISDPNEQLKVREDAQNGKVAAAYVRSTLGNEVYQMLGIKFDSNTPEFTEESFKAALGLLVQNIAIENGSMSAKKGGFAGRKQTMLSVNWDSVSTDKTDLVKAMAKLQYLNENRNRPLPRTSKPEPKNRMVMNTRIPVNERDNKRLNSMEQIPYTISPKLQRWLEMDEADVLIAMGYVDVDSADLHVSEQSAQEARNDKLVREWEILKAFAKGVGKKEFYLDWGQTVSGRFTILNDIQYQESKLHREFVVANGSTVEIDVKKPEDVEMLKASILQGLDMDPDKLSLNTATANFDNMFKVTDKGIEVVVDGPVKRAYEALRKGEINSDATAEVFADSEGHHGISSIELLVDWDAAIKGNGKFKTHANIEIDAITSGMILTLLQIGSDQAIRLAEKGGIYTEERLPELDKYVKKWLTKDTEFTPGALIEAGKAHAKTIEDKMKNAKTPAEKAELRTELEDDVVFKDLYSTIGVAMIGEVQDYKDKLQTKNRNEAEDKQLAMLNQIGELNLKNIRSIAKSPVMVYIYGATINSIKKKLTHSLGVETLVKTIKSASEKLKKGKDAKEELKFIDMFIPNKKYKNRFGKKVESLEEWEMLLNLEIDEKTIQDIDSVINATFGKAIEIAFESRLGFVDRNRDAVKTIEMLTFEAYKVRLAEEVKFALDEKYGPDKHNGETNKLSKEDLVEINAKLTQQGFGHDIVWDEGETRVNQTLNKTGDTGSKYSTTVQVGDVKSSAQIKENKAIVNTGAAATIPIHAIDGRMILDTLTRELDGKYSGGNVYDAVVLSVDKAMLTDTADFYNRGMIETGFNRSIVADQLGKLENMLASMDDDQKKQMFKAIGLRGEADYTNEANRLKLNTGKMLERIELAEEINQQRLKNSAKGYYSGHLFQMGSGVTKIDSSEIRAKQLPEVKTLKDMLINKLNKDRQQTAKEFGNKVIGNPDYVLNLNDLNRSKPEIKSKANIAQMNWDGEKLRVQDKLWDSLSSNDTVEIIGNVKLDNLNRSQKIQFGRVKNGIINSDANIVNNKNVSKEIMEESGRELVDGVWVKPKTKPAETKVEEGKMLTKEIIEAAKECAKG